jgi:DNA relaxase NicK
MRFDAYKASLPRGTDAEQVINFMALQNPSGSIQEGRPRFGYETCVSLRDGEGDRWVDVLHGKHNGTLIEVSGEASPAVVEIVRENFPGHAVTRADVCEDMIVDEPGLFGRLAPRLDELVRAHGRVGAHGIIPRVRAEDGATYTIGSRTSETFLRAYQKPEQLVSEGLGHKSLRFMFDRWVRVELEAKPQKDNRLRAATFEPLDFFGLSRISRSVCADILAVPVERTSVVDYKVLTTKQRQRRVCLKQWGNMLHAWKEDLGSWAELGIAIRESLETLDAEKNSR